MVSDFVFAADTAAILLVLFILTSKIAKLTETIEQGLNNIEAAILTQNKHKGHK